MLAKFLPSCSALALLLFAASSLHAAAPQATFVLVKGWLKIRVEQDGVGVKDAKVRVLDLGGTTLLDGELGDDGTGSVPLDRRSAYLVGITIPGKKKESDFITLRRHGDTLTPTRVSLGFSKPCCRAALPPRPAPAAEVETPPPDRRPTAWIMLGVSGACLVAAGMMLMFFRRP
jgi:hypothetical protein